MRSGSPDYDCGLLKVCSLRNGSLRRNILLVVCGEYGMSSLEYETVYTVLDYWDGIRTGIADFHGAPHYYERPFDEARDNWADNFLLKPIDEETLRLALEG
jgi:hypothetical protein